MTPDEMDNYDEEKSQSKHTEMAKSDSQQQSQDMSEKAREGYADGNVLDKREFEQLDNAPSPHVILARFNFYHVLQFFFLLFGAVSILSIVIRETSSQLRTPPSRSDSKARVELWDGWQKLQHHFVFGDSYSDQAFDPHGAQPSSANPFGNPDWMVRPSSGSNWVHFTGVQYNQTFLKTYDLAVGSSVVDPSVIVPYLNSSLASFDAQIHAKYLPIYADSQSELFNPRTMLHSVFFGISDISLTCVEGKRTPVAHVLHSYRQYLEVLYNSGARNFLLLNVPPFYRNIVHDPNRDEDALVSDVFAWNEQLALLKESFVEFHHDVTVFLFDTWKLYADVLADSSRFSQTAWLRNVTDWCPSYSKGTIELDQLDSDCGVAVNEHFWLNEMHPTYPIHDATAARIVSDCFGKKRKAYCS